MKLLCCGDFHLGAGADYGPRPGERLRDQASVLDSISEIAREEGVAAVLFAGDAFERRSPSPSELLVWRTFVDSLAAAEIELVAIAGNHDVASADLPTGMEVVAECERFPAVSYAVPGLRVGLLPWTPPSRLVAHRNGGDRDAIHAEAAELLLESARGLRQAIASEAPEATSILLAHWSVSGAALPNGLPVDQLREPVLDAYALESLGFDFVVLGHIHQPQQIGGALTRIFYVGTPAPCNFGEAAGEHGVFIIDTDARSGNFREIASRPFVTVDADLTVPVASQPNPSRMAESSPDGRAFSPEAMVLGNAPTPVEYLDATDVIAAAIAEQLPLQDAVVRIRYRATAEQARRVDHAALRGFVADAGASKLYSIAPEIVRTDRARVEGVDETIGETQALDLWLAAQGSELDSEQFAALSQKHFDYLEAVRA